VRRLPALPLVLIAALLTPAAPAQAQTAELRIATWNTEVGRSTADFRAGVVALAARSDVFALQEVDTKAKEEVLKSLAGWSYYRVKPGLQTPVAWRTDRFDFVSARVVQISRDWYIGNEIPRRGHTELARHVTVVRLVDKLTGTNVSVIDVHLVSGASENGWRVPGRPRLFRIYLRNVALTHAITAYEQSWGQVFTLGDFNSGWVADSTAHRWKMPFSTLGRLGMRSMWATERPAGKWGTHEHSLLDQIYSRLPANTAKVQWDIKHSDHKPALATYTLSTP
jgi:endonuclease/exonuclease/phosphatase family metal-dependent hydrolase